VGITEGRKKRKSGGKVVKGGELIKAGGGEKKRVKIRHRQSQKDLCAGIEKMRLRNRNRGSSTWEAALKHRGHGKSADLERGFVVPRGGQGHP